MQTAIPGFLLVCGTVTHAQENRPCPLVGAIRWDAWTGGAVIEQVKKILAPRKYHDRLPWFAEVIDNRTVEIDGGRQVADSPEIAVWNLRNEELRHWRPDEMRIHLAD